MFSKWRVNDAIGTEFGEVKMVYL